LRRSETYGRAFRLHHDAVGQVLRLNRLQQTNKKKS
jgi:hypothetical protein